MIGRSESIESIHTIKTIQRELETMFTFVDTPISDDCCAEYVANFLSNNCKKWKIWFFEHDHGRYKDCPDETFAMLSKYWLSLEGMRESDAMKEKRALFSQGAFIDLAPSIDKSQGSQHLNKRSRVDGDPSSDSLPNNTEGGFSPEVANPIS